MELHRIPPRRQTRSEHLEGTVDRASPPTFALVVQLVGAMIDRVHRRGALGAILHAVVTSEAHFRDESRSKGTACPAQARRFEDGGTAIADGDAVDIRDEEGPETKCVPFPRTLRKEAA